jgi:nucleotide-binding universal stress UspA family protein
MFKTILVPINLSDPEFAKPALAAAAALARAFTAKLHLVHVVPVTPVMLAEFVPADFEAQQRQSAEEALEIVAAETRLDAGQVSTRVRQGSIYDEILDEAGAIKADLIVMSSHQPAMTTYLLGSNAAHVVRHAKCSVLVVRT